MFARMKMRQTRRLMPELIALVTVAILLTLVAWLSYRARVLFELEICDHQVKRARGRIPAKLLNDLLDVSPHGSGSRMYIRCVVEHRQPRIVARGGVTTDDLQQLRNLLGMWPLARLRSARRIHV